MKYFGNPCKYGHSGERYTIGGKCVECAKAAAIAWNKSHPDLYSEYKAEWQRTHLQNTREAALKWQRNHPERATARSNRRRASKIQRIPLWANLVKIQAFYDEAKRITKETGIAYHVDHVLPLRGSKVSGLHVENNLQVIPAVSNLRKSNKVTFS